MIRHIVFSTCSEANRVKVCDGLSLLGNIPHAQKFEIASNAKIDLYGNDVDIIVYAEFADEDAFHAYKSHALYEEATNLVKPLRDIRIAADYNTDALYSATPR